VNTFTAIDVGVGDRDVPGFTVGVGVGGGGGVGDTVDVELAVELGVGDVDSS